MNLSVLVILKKNLKMKKYLLQVKIVDGFQIGTFAVINNLPSCPVQQADGQDEVI